LKSYISIFKLVEAVARQRYRLVMDLVLRPIAISIMYQKL